MKSWLASKQNRYQRKKRNTFHAMSFGGKQATNQWNHQRQESQASPLAWKHLAPMQCPSHTDTPQESFASPCFGTRFRSIVFYKRNEEKKNRNKGRRKQHSFWDRNEKNSWKSKKAENKGSKLIGKKGTDHLSLSLVSLWLKGSFGRRNFKKTLQYWKLKK
jgi:hypothetical protein